MARAEGVQSGIGERRRAAREDGSEEYQERCRELVKAAAVVFREKGYQATTLKDIAERVGSDRASIYYYFGGKEELYQEAAGGVLDANLKEIERIAALSLPAAEKLRFVIGQILSSYSDNYPYPYVYIQEDMGRGLDDSQWVRKMARKARRLEMIVEDVVADAQDEDEARADVSPAVATKALFGMINWTHRWLTPDDTVSIDELIDAFFKIFWTGMEAGSA
jgi:AcrR family transcriptional regulator